MNEFISEDDLRTFEGWLKYQAVDAATTSLEDLEKWRRLFEEARERTVAYPKVGLMKLKPVPGEHRYAVPVQEGSDLWLTLWVKRSREGEFSSCCRAEIGLGVGTTIKLGTITRVIASKANST